MGPLAVRAAARPPLWLAALLVAGVALLAAALAQAPALRLLDAQLHERQTRLGAAAEAPSGVVLVDIDEASLSQLGPWPWPRPLLADLALRLRERGARLQVWDLFLPEPAKGDTALARALAVPGAPADVVLGQVLVLDPQVQSPPLQGSLRASRSAPEVCADVPVPVGHLGVADSLPGLTVGHVSATPELDGGQRRLPAVVCVGPQRYPQLALAAAELLQPADAWVRSPGSALLGPAAWLQRGPLRFALDAQGFLPIPYRRHHAQWPAVSAVKVLEGGTGGPPLQGRVVVVGATALGLADAVRTPFHANAPGASVHAELLAAALGGGWPVAPAQPALPALLVAALLGLGLVAALPRLQRPAPLAAACLLAAGAAVAVGVGARAADVLWPLAAPVAALLTLGFVLGALQVEAARRQAGRLERHLESFLPRNLAREIVRQHPSGESLGRPEAGAVLALRVVGLERWSAAADSFKALGLVHGICSLAERLARTHGGTLEHLQGEVLLLAWPAAGPEPATPQAVQQAVAAARGLQAELGALLAGAETERHPLGARAALDVGPYLLAVAGPRNSRRTLMLGPAVDRVLGLLALCDELASPLLMGQRAASTSPGCALRPMGHFLLPDAAEPQAVYRVEP